jgi:hypothetical protein
MSRVIRIDDEVFAWLASQAEPFVDNPNSVLRRVAGLQPTKNVIVTVRGPTRPTTKLTPQQVIEIRRRYAEGGISMSQLAEEYGVVATNINLIIQRKTWKDLPE